MTKSQSGMVTKGITQLATNTLPVLVIQSAFSLLQLGGYLLSITTLNRYQPRDSSRKILFTTSSCNTSIVSYGMSLVTIPVADLGGTGGAHPPGHPNSFDFMQFSGKFGKIICWRPPLGSWRPPWGNPGSAAAYCSWI